MLGFDLRCTNMTIIISQICALYIQCISTHWIEQKHAKQRTTFIFILVAFHIKKNEQIKGRWEQKKSFNQHHVCTWKINVLVNNREFLYSNKKKTCISLYTNVKRVKLFKKTRKSLTKALWIFHFQQLKQCDKFNRKKTKQCHIEKKMVKFKSIPLLMCKSFIHIADRCYW